MFIPSCKWFDKNLQNTNKLPRQPSRGGLEVERSLYDSASVDSNPAWDNDIDRLRN